MSVRKQPDGRWEAYVNYKDWQGRPKVKHKMNFARKKDAQDFEAAFRNSSHHESIDMAQLIAEFKKDLTNKAALGNIKKSTLDLRLRQIRISIEPYFSQQDAEAVKPAHINEWLQTINTPTKVAERKSSNYLNQIRNVLEQIFEYGIKNFNLSGNPVKLSEKAKAFTSDKRERLWTLEQYNTFYASLTDEQHKVIFNTLFWAGLRIGECLALTPADLAPYSIRINKNLVQPRKEAQYITTPKRAASVRVVEIPASLYEQLKAYADKACDNETDLIFNLTAHALNRLLTYKADKLQLPRISPHILRHSYASMLLALSKDVAVVSAQIGHSNPDTTLRVYSHMIPGSNRAMVDQLAALKDKK